MNSKVNYLAGESAEESVVRRYQSMGLDVLHTRWRGGGGEVDIIARDKTGLVFVEVKKSKSFGAAAARVTQAKIRRLYACASSFLANWPTGLATDCRFDVALVNGVGEIEVLENALCQ